MKFWRIDFLKQRFNSIQRTCNDLHVSFTHGLNLTYFKSPTARQGKSTQSSVYQHFGNFMFEFVYPAIIFLLRLFESDSKNAEFLKKIFSTLGHNSGNLSKLGSGNSSTNVFFFWFCFFFLYIFRQSLGSFRYKHVHFTTQQTFRIILSIATTGRPPNILILDPRLL